MFVVCFTVVFLLSCVKMLGIMTPEAENEIGLLIIIGALFPLVMFTWQEISSSCR